MTNCNTTQHTVTQRNTLQHTATHCKTLQHTAKHCNTLQERGTYYNHQERHAESSQRHGDFLGEPLTTFASPAHPLGCLCLQCVAVCCSVLQYVVACGSVLQREYVVPYKDPVHKRPIVSFVRKIELHCSCCNETSTTQLSNDGAWSTFFFLVATTRTPLPIFTQLFVCAFCWCVLVYVGVCWCVLRCVAVCSRVLLWFAHTRPISYSYVTCLLYIWHHSIIEAICPARTPRVLPTCHASICHMPPIYITPLHCRGHIACKHLQHIATHRNTPQHTANTDNRTHRRGVPLVCLWGVRICKIRWCDIYIRGKWHMDGCPTMRWSWRCCSVNAVCLQCVAVYCSVVQCTARCRCLLHTLGQSLNHMSHDSYIYDTTPSYMPWLVCIWHVRVCRLILCVHLCVHIHS